MKPKNVISTSQDLVDVLKVTERVIAEKVEKLLAVSGAKDLQELITSANAFTDEMLSGWSAATAKESRKALVRTRILRTFRGHTEVNEILNYAEMHRVPEDPEEFSHWLGEALDAVIDEKKRKHPLQLVVTKDDHLLERTTETLIIKLMPQMAVLVRKLQRTPISKEILLQMTKYKSGSFDNAVARLRTLVKSKTGIENFIGYNKAEDGYFYPSYVQVKKHRK